jgi:arsenate reductase-like glutaredoxin family protein
VLNGQSATWRKLDEAGRADVVDAASARRLMLGQPSVIKRPVAEWQGGRVTVDYDAQRWPPT